MAGKDGQEHGVGVAHQADNRKEQKDGADGPKCTDVVPTFTHLFEHAGRVPPDIHGLDAHHQQRCDYSKVADAIDHEAPALAEGTDHQAGDGGAY